MQTTKLNAGNYQLEAAFKVLAGQYPSASVLVTDNRGREGMFHVGFTDDGNITHVKNYGGSFVKPTERLAEKIREIAHTARVEM